MTSFFKKPDPKEQMRQTERALRKTQRDLERDRRDLDKQEKDLEAEIRKMARQGNKAGCAVLAKQLLNIRNQRTKSYQMSAKVSGVNSQAKAMNSNMKMAGAIRQTTQTMGQVNRQMNPMAVANTMREFEKASTHMDMSEELINDTLDNILDESGDEEEQDAIVQKVLDEIGIEMSGKVAAAPIAKGAVGESSTAKAMTDADVERLLQKLKST